MNITTLTDEQRAALESTNTGIPEKVVIEYINETGDEELKDLEEAFSGEFDDDKDFAMDMADQLGSVPNNVQWPLTCIDWEFAARELMTDYFEIEGYYFRSL